jgi:hypothetical protein
MARLKEEEFTLPFKKIRRSTAKSGPEGFGFLGVVLNPLGKSSLNNPANISGLLPLRRLKLDLF